MLLSAGIAVSHFSEKQMRWGNTLAIHGIPRRECSGSAKVQTFCIVIRPCQQNFVPMLDGSLRLPLAL